MPHNQADLRHIQAILGYTQITSTEFYTHLALEDLKEAVRRSHPQGVKRSITESIFWVMTVWSSSSKSHARARCPAFGLASRICG